MSQILFLNGASSAGKSSLARAIQEQSERPWLLVGVDLFFDMLPRKYTALGTHAPEGFAFIPGANERGPTMDVQIGPYAQAVTEAGIRNIGRFADDGFDLIIDEVLCTTEQEVTSKLIQSYQKALQQHQVYFIGVYCPFPILQQRELQRGDRHLGLANAQEPYVHQKKWIYDVSVDTGSQSPEELAKNILDFIAQQPHPRGLP